MINNNDYNIFRENSLFKGVPTEEIKALYSLSKEVIVEEGDFLLREGDQARDFYFVMDGDLEVNKCDSEVQGQTFVIGRLKKGDTIGEMALLDKGVRSASVFAKTSSRLRSLSFEQMQKIGSVDLYVQLAINLTQRVRQVNTTVVTALRQQVEEYKTRSNMGVLLITIIALLSAFTFTLEPIKQLLRTVPTTTFITIPFLFLLIICAYIASRPFNLPFQFFGVTKQNWKQSLCDGFILSIPLLGLAILAKWLLIQYLPVYHGAPLFDPFASIQQESKKTILFWSMSVLVYWLFVPLQEILARGIFQGLLEKILTGKRKIMSSILVSNLMFGAAHVWISQEIAIATFISGIYFGWIYSRTHNLIGVTIAHCLCGAFALLVLGAIPH